MCVQYKCPVKNRSEENPPPRLLDQVRERARYLHYSLRTEKAYVYWIRMFVRWSGLRHPREMGEPEVKAFLTMLAPHHRGCHLERGCESRLPAPSGGTRRASRLGQSQ